MEELARRYSEGKIDHLDGVTVGLQGLVVQLPAEQYRAAAAAEHRGQDPRSF